MLVSNSVRDRGFFDKNHITSGETYDKNLKYFYESDEDFMAALRKDYKKIDIQRELQVVDLTNGGKIQPYVKGLQIENELNKVL